MHALPPIGMSGEWSGTGDDRPRAFAAGSAEDVTVREYRLGDDLRRVHWRSTARTGELMVRREEQPWQSRATVLLDSRLVAHEGSGPGSSLEWAVTAAASIAVHLARTGFAVRLLTDHPDVEAATWHDHTLSPQAQAGPVLDQLAVLAPSAARAPHRRHAGDHPAARPAGGGARRGSRRATCRTSPAALPPGSRGWPCCSTPRPGSRSRHGRADREAPSRREAAGAQVRQHAAMLAAAGWVTLTAGPRDPVPAVWQRLGARLGGVFVATGPGYRDERPVVERGCGSRRGHGSRRARHARRWRRSSPTRVPGRRRFAGALVAATGALCRLGHLPAPVTVPLQLVVLFEWMTFAYARSEAVPGRDSHRRVDRPPRRPRPAARWRPRR